MNPNHDLYEIAKDIIIPLFGSVLSFTAILIALLSLKSSNKVAKANYELQITLSHRETWQKIGELKLNRIKDATADPNEIEELEYIYTNFVIHNVKNMYYGIARGILGNKRRKVAHMKDIGKFISFPIPNKVWSQVKQYHETPFQKFIEDSQKVFRGEPLPLKGLKKAFKNLRIWMIVISNKGQVIFFLLVTKSLSRISYKALRMAAYIRTFL
ncbi:MAG: hypothetical protein ABIN91_01585 [Mucilaginibacter sp.]|uniref:hypothetical protein n=1 Tax=Mucilaginibacter sp. TaxID=1882438 RepID=UPI0032677F4F